MGRLVDLTGQRFGRLVVIERAGSRGKSGAAAWKCRCDCGKIVVVIGRNLRTGNTSSCGCLADEQRNQLATMNIIHGAACGGRRTRLYHIWSSMKKRCYNHSAINPDMFPISTLVLGKDAGQRIFLPYCPNPHIAVHNHPSGQAFSLTDIKKFIASGSMEMMTAVGNNGVLYIARKTPEYDGFLAYQQYQVLEKVLNGCVETEDMGGYINAVMAFLEGGRAYGLEFVKSGA